MRYGIKEVGTFKKEKPENFEFIKEKKILGQ